MTAGHCVYDYQHNICMFGVRWNQHRYIPDKWKSNYRFIEEDGVDFGYIQIPANEISQFSAGIRVFAGIDRLLPINSEQVRSRDDWMVLAGYPASIAEKTEEGQGMRLLCGSTVLAGIGNAPISTMPIPNQPIEYTDLWFPEHGNIQPADNYNELIIPQLAGSSGGGCWIAGVRGNDTKWSPSHLRLTGIHVASSQSEDQENRFAREVLIGHHLRLIAEDYRNMRSYIYERWPHLQERRWEI